jgi:HPt (histidine-containing phosphotransfer) domain-containing protein
MSHAPADGRSSPVDSRVLDDFRSYDGTGEILDELIGIFLDDSPGRLAALDQAVSDDDTEATFNEAHALKGSAAQLGALGLSETCRRIEALGRSGTTEGTAALLQEAHEEYARVAEVLQANRL